MSEKITIQQILSNAAKMLRAEYEETTSESHIAQQGSERENLLIKFLEKRLPKNIELAKGHAIDLQDTQSPQLDIMVFDPFQTIKYRNTTGSTYIPYDSLNAWIEVKSKLTRHELKKSFETAEKTKKLRRTQINTDSGDVFQPPCPRALLFAFDTDLRMDQMLDAFVTNFNSVELGYQLDCVFVFDKFDLSITTVNPNDGLNDPVCSHLFLQPAVQNGISVWLPNSDVISTTQIPDKIDISPPRVIRAEAWQTGEMTLWAFVRYLINAVIKQNPFSPQVFWGINEVFEWKSTNLAYCLDVNLPPEKYSNEIERIQLLCDRTKKQKSHYLVIESGNQEIDLLLYRNAYFQSITSQDIPRRKKTFPDEQRLVLQSSSDGTTAVDTSLPVDFPIKKDDIVFAELKTNGTKTTDATMPDAIRKMIEQNRGL